MSNKPKALTRKEMREIARIEAIREMWGAETVSEMEELLDVDVYAVKFRYQSDSPGYVGDYFILQGGALCEPLELIRNKEGAITLMDR
jgi:hypothetical protein